MEFITSNLKHGFCYPVWMDDDDIVSQVRRDLSSVKGADSVTTDATETDSLRLIDVGRDEDKKEARVERVETERRAEDTAREMSSESSPSDIDEIIAKIMKKRDALLEKNAQAAEDIKQLKLENENLRSLNVIAKREQTTQKEEIVRLKISAARDRMENTSHVNKLNQTIRSLEAQVKELNDRALHARNALDDGLF